MVNELDPVGNYLTLSSPDPTTSAPLTDQFDQYQDWYWAHPNKPNGESDEYEDNNEEYSGSLETNQYSGHDTSPNRKASKVSKCH
ncbi:hypothetical protein O181_014370 [Austropuccinia psidii MF-1]|uniref:Uncharacterized protein n=1 Tax=Austropuccinia psidii MF-1 TaxID=1389203 RepID=A0A9Q3GPV0_9BASI|nr:hypothetical protein [Austropuccinia psidii MF-1]